MNAHSNIIRDNPKMETTQIYISTDNKLKIKTKPCILNNRELFVTGKESSIDRRLNCELWTQDGSKMVDTDGHVSYYSFYLVCPKPVNLQKQKSRLVVAMAGGKRHW